MCGHRYCSSASPALLPEDTDEHTMGEHHLLIRRYDDTGELAYLPAWLQPHLVTQMPSTT